MATIERTPATRVRLRRLVDPWPLQLSPVAGRQTDTVLRFLDVVMCGDLHQYDVRRWEGVERAIYFDSLAK